MRCEGIRRSRAGKSDKAPAVSLLREDPRGLMVFCKLFGGLVTGRFEGSERPGVGIQSKSVDLGGVPPCETPLEGVKKVPGQPNLLVRGD
jgi:hypothetical protein